MKSKKQMIQETAIQLFNQKGYEQVSLRDIAIEAGTTIGNLTYHFPKKEDLLLHIQLDFHKTFDHFFDIDLVGKDLLKQIITTFRKAESNEAESPFYYKNIYDLTKGSEIASKENVRFQKELFDYYTKSFRQLKNDNIISDSISDLDIVALAQAIITLLAVWLQSNTPFNNPNLDRIPISIILSSILKSYISKEYTEYYHNVCIDKITNILI